MLKALKRLFGETASASKSDERRLERSVASLLYEMTRMDLEVRPEDLSTARLALTDLFGVVDEEARLLLHDAAEPANRLTSYYDAVSAINQQFDAETKLRLVEHLWRVAYADTSLDLHEDHLVRKVSDLMYVPHVQCMLARSRARDSRNNRA